MSKRTFTAIIGGEPFEIPTSMTVLSMAEIESGISLPDAMSAGLPVGFVQGMLYAGMKLAGKEVEYEQVGELCDFAETQKNYIAAVTAMAPDVPEEPEKNAPPEEPKP
jgi:hypothetical protein